MQDTRKIALMTWFGFHNYGTALQVSALYTTLVRLGYYVDVVSYSPKSKYTARPKWEGCLHAIGELTNKAANKLTNLKYTPSERELLFEQYINDALSFTNPCPTMADLEGLNDKYDTFICGSDQIWAPSIFDPHYFLDFAGEDRLKIAYAPSVGLQKIDDSDVARQMAKLCSRLDALSTREESGSKIVSALTGREVATVLDPTLLISQPEWDSIAGTTNIEIDKPYLLAYMLGKNEDHWKKIYALANKLNLKVRIIPVFKADLHRSGCIADPIGPREFISLLAHASYVCTDSFHGVAFSVNLERDFCAFERFKKNDLINQNSRIYNLLNIVGLRDRLVNECSNIERFSEAIDWNDPHRKLVSERNASLKWLKNSLLMKPQVTYNSAKDNIVYNRTLCCGCTACKAICPVGAIEIVLDGEGFYSARVDENICISCGQCRKVCPFVEHSSSKPIEEGTLFSYKCSDAEQLLISSSGGAADAIAKAASAADMAVFGCAFDTQHGGAVSKLIMPGDVKGIGSLAGSKYMQSEVGDALVKAAAYKNSLVITGTPCQVAAARNLLREHENVTYVDFICHGVPSRNLYIRYREWLHEQYGIDLENAKTDFRYKPCGWRERYIYTTDGSHDVCHHQRSDPYFLMFEAMQCYASCCYECPWRATSAADVRIGDYWGPRFKNDRTGVSMILALTNCGSKIVQILKKSGVVARAPISDYINFQQTANKPEPVFRDIIMSKLADPSTNLQTMCEEFAEPVAEERDLVEKLNPLKSLAKKLTERH